ncbi:Skg6p NDAI_0C03190 [Naumovozyma dairenensis CBS 421]|uniref:Uncharacterized protein n=1 Tax=Naumovozyma dairenensis (strain ATCC 10597 / BCRC 20456 / CBS 421 / NBRC 0211 / NRRL Y-12639) TaxID=1071378 RepID=G0W868_NAUDC|nr:hypothetical protein NDAI_0C03190 [Naumovozyma dairenensis CBS 421]CCD23979.1 hypothetical protein NDAI_0C03190 [Naumovozyma dairenensis CBS 421]
MIQMRSVDQNSLRPRTTAGSFQYLYKRADSDSSSSSKTSSSKSTKCTGTKAQCEKPSMNSHSTSVTVGVAVAVPVAVVIIALAAILIVVYKRSKREAQEDNDPDFDGDGEYLPNVHPYATQPQYYPTNDPQFATRNQNTYPPQQQQQPPIENPFSNMQRVDSSWAVEPFQLPNTDDTNSLREFAKQVQNDKLGGYHLASRNGSRVELSQQSSSVSIPTIKDTIKFAATDDSRFETNNNGYSNSQRTGTIDFESSSNGSPNTFLDEKLVKNSTVSIPTDELPLNTTQNAIQNTLEPYNDAFEFENNREDDADENNEDDYTIPLSSSEEEDIKRMKSIYQVYLDRNGTTYQKAGKMNESDTPLETATKNTNLPMEQTTYPTEVVEDVSNQYGNLDFQSNHENKNTDTSATLAVPTSKTRAASSIYSEAPFQLSAQQHYQPQQSYQQPQQQYPQYLQPLQQVPPQPYLQYPPQAYNPQNQYYQSQQQFNHPQTLETIGELPTPTGLMNSASSHSLTSFRNPSKQQIQLQTARLNGTALNPVDHPEMFYTSTPDAYNNGQGNGYAGTDASIQTNMKKETSTAPLPFQLRQSIVMTNPHDLQAVPTHKPAGSFRNINAANNSRNNSLTSQTNPYYQQQQRQFNSRVSGILEETDTVQPPRMGAILPHSGSQEDLRRQLGSSDNYNVT